MMLRLFELVDVIRVVLSVFDVLVAVCVVVVCCC